MQLWSLKFFKEMFHPSETNHDLAEIVSTLMNNSTAPCTMHTPANPLVVFLGPGQAQGYLTRRKIINTLVTLGALNGSAPSFCRK